jgi:hypothetical protein
VMVPLRSGRSGGIYSEALFNRLPCTTIFKESQGVNGKAVLIPSFVIYLTAIVEHCDLFSSRCWSKSLTVPLKPDQTFFVSLRSLQGISREDKSLGRSRRASFFLAFQAVGRISPRLCQGEDGSFMLGSSRHCLQLAWIDLD